MCQVLTSCQTSLLLATKVCKSSAIASCPKPLPVSHSERSSRSSWNSDAQGSPCSKSCWHLSLNFHHPWEDVYWSLSLSTSLWPNYCTSSAPQTCQAYTWPRGLCNSSLFSPNVSYALWGWLLLFMSTWPVLASLNSFLLCPLADLWLILCEAIAFPHCLSFCLTSFISPPPPRTKTVSFRRKINPLLCFWVILVKLLATKASLIVCTIPGMSGTDSSSYSTLNLPSCIAQDRNS